MNFSLSTILVGVLLLLVQVLAALPWAVVVFLSRDELLALRRRAANPAARRSLLRGLVQRGVIVLAACFVVPVLVQQFVQDQGSLEVLGRIYGAVLQLQLTIDLFILAFYVVLKFFPKAGAVALSSFRGGVREPMFWLLTLLACFFMLVSIILPYYTFGEDYHMVKQLGYDTIMLAAVLFGALAASQSISEEIEGRTAITVMSKPVSRRQFMMGKYAGLLLAALFMFGMLAVAFEGVLMVKHWWEKLEPLTQKLVKESQAEQARIGVVPTPAWVITTLEAWNLPSQASDVLRGLGQWTAHSADTLPALALCFSQVMVLVALAVALATRLPMVVNLVTVLVVYIAAHMTPVLIARSESEEGWTRRLLGFVAQVFNTILPDLRSFTMDPALLGDAPPPPAQFLQYVGSVTLYGVVYTAIVLLFGLILFEDKDLA
jgi:hypothetical protein